MTVLLLAALGTLPPAALAQTEGAATGASPGAAAAPTVLLKHHEPNYVGATKDSDDVPFMDFTLSLQHPLFAGLLEQGRKGWLPYFAFTGRFGQYFRRDSAPVIAKRFNPEIFVRLSDGFKASGSSPDAYVDLAYGHESNGQSIDSAAEYQAEVQIVESADFANDRISRGWDYAKIEVKRPVAEGVTLYLERKWHFGGLLQQEMEQLFAFESPRAIRSIKQVSGWRLLAKADLPRNALVDSLTMTFDTGVEDSFRYNTARLEAGVPFLLRVTGVPLVVWVQNGHLSDIAQYYRRVNSGGVAFRFESL
jgi:hypothetical protein